MMVRPAELLVQTGETSSSSNVSLPLRFATGDPLDVAVFLGESGKLMAADFGTAQTSRHSKEKDNMMFGLYTAATARKQWYGYRIRLQRR